MRRTVTAVGLCVALQVGALCAPLVHAHLDDHDADHHGAPRVHAHLSGHHAAGHDASASGVAVSSEDESEDVTRLQVFVAVPVAGFGDLALPVARFVLPVAPESVMRRRLEIVRSHGPPDTRLAGSRAPPASLS